MHDKYMGRVSSAYHHHHHHKFPSSGLSQTVDVISVCGLSLKAKPPHSDISFFIAAKLLIFVSTAASSGLVIKAHSSKSLH